jgi:hypothetical protein
MALVKVKYSLGLLPRASVFTAFVAMAFVDNTTYHWSDNSFAFILCYFNKKDLLLFKSEIKS